ncbi:HD domain-containing protein [Pseudomonas sp. LP_7_YM]|nr:HD domain-containing protein [Pseudomonas sp. LP_7_YM]
MDDRLHCRTSNPGLIRCREKRGFEEPQDHALGRSRGGLTTKIHMLCDANGVPAALLHDVIEDTEITQEALAEAFGTDVASTVACLSKNLIVPFSYERYFQAIERAP